MRIDEAIVKLAAEASNAMERVPKSYDPDEMYVRVKDDGPEWVKDLVREAHGTSILPDDYRYETIRDALDAIEQAQYRDESEVSSEFADDTDIYNSDLLKWVGSHASRAGYVDEAVKEFGPPRDFFHGIQMGQYLERQEIFGDVMLALAGRAGDIEDEQLDTEETDEDR